MIGLGLVADDAEQHKAGHRQAKQCRISRSPGHLEVIPEVEGTMDVELEVCSMMDLKISDISQL